jgi:hypothetical protein
MKWKPIDYFPDGKPRAYAIGKWQVFYAISPHRGWYFRRPSGITSVSWHKTPYGAAKFMAPIRDRRVRIVDLEELNE